jgi:uncharacterized integral membrane protein
MRILLLILLLLVFTALAIFAFQNHELVTLHFLRWSLAMPLSLLILGVYFLGMVSGWSVIGFVRKSMQRVAERR